MQDNRAWSVNLGTWGGVSVRLHAFFFLIGIFALYVAAHGNQDTEILWYALGTLVILFGSVLLHESAHCLAAVRVGGSASEIVIGPFGGLAKLTVPQDPRSQLLVSLAGPAANLLLTALGLFLLLVMGQSKVFGLLNPLIPEAVIDNAPWRIVLLKLAVWVNWVLVLVNLLPAFPFDGGRALGALLRPVWGARSSALIVTRVAWCTAVALCLAAWLLRDVQVNDHVPVWLPLLLLALFLFFSSNQEVDRREPQELEDDLFEYELSHNFTGFASAEEEEEHHEEEKGLLRRWLEKRREEKERMLRQQEEAEETRVDEILIRIQGVGLQGLSAEERALLQRVSARYRNRQKQSP